MYAWEFLTFIFFNWCVCVCVCHFHVHFSFHFCANQSPHHGVCIHSAVQTDLDRWETPELLHPGTLYRLCIEQEKHDTFIWNTQANETLFRFPLDFVDEPFVSAVLEAALLPSLSFWSLCFFRFWRIDSLAFSYPHILVRKVVSDSTCSWFTYQFWLLLRFSRFGLLSPRFSDLL